MRSRLRWLGEQVSWFLGIAECLVLVIVLLPPIPLFEMHDDIRRAYEEKRTSREPPSISKRHPFYSVHMFDALPPDKITFATHLHSEYIDRRL